MKTITYPDGGKYAINDAKETSIVYRINSYEDLFLLKSFKDANPNLKEVTIPCMFQQQHDCRFNPNESFELKLVCDFINSCGFEKVKVFHPHSSVTPALLHNCEVIDNSEFITKVLLKLKNFENLILLSADAGGYKPLIKLANILEWDEETFSASKSRDPKTHKLTQMIDRKDFGGKDVLIVDDLSVYGGTFKGLATMLKERNCGKLYLAVSHITMENLGDDPVTIYFEKVFTTNSKFDSYYIKYKTNYVSYDREGNEVVEYDKVCPENLTVIKLF